MTSHDTPQTDLVADQLDRLTEALCCLLATDVTDTEPRDVPNVVDAVHALTKAVREGSRSITAELSSIAFALANGRPDPLVYDFSDPGPVVPDRR